MFRILNKTFKGFTLAEALTALTIIGIVAALTLPSVYSNYHWQIMRAKVLYFSKIMNEALENALNENYGQPFIITKNCAVGGCPEEIAKIMDRLRPYLPITKECGIETNSECAYNGIYLYFGKGCYHGDGKSFNNSHIPYYKFNLADGSHVYIWTGKIADCETINNAYQVYYDMNGDKGPNQFGKDLFVFKITEKHQLKVHGCFDGTWTASDCTTEDNKMAGCLYGTTCSFKVLSNIKY